MQSRRLNNYDFSDGPRRTSQGTAVYIYATNSLEIHRRLFVDE